MKKRWEGWLHYRQAKNKNNNEIDYAPKGKHINKFNETMPQ